MAETVLLNDLVGKQLQLNPSIPPQLQKNYEDVICKMTNYYASDPRVFAVVLFGSLARGQAVAGSSIDLAVFVYPEYSSIFFDAEETRKRIVDYTKMGGKPHYFWGETCGPRLGKETEYAVDFNDIRVDLMFRDDIARSRDQLGICMDQFELGVGNLFVYCVPLYKRDAIYDLLAKKYLPFYNEDIRKERLDATSKEFEYRIQKSRWMAEREELVNGLFTLQMSFRIFLQHLFIRRRKYPIHYRKWLAHQIVDILHEPDLHEKIKQLFTLREFSGDGLKIKSAFVYDMMAEFGKKDIM